MIFLWESMYCEVLDDLGADTKWWSLWEIVTWHRLIPSSHQVRHDSNFMNWSTGWSEAKRSEALALRHLWVSSCPVIGTPQIWCLVDEPCWLSIVTWTHLGSMENMWTKRDKTLHCFICFPWFILNFRWYWVTVHNELNHWNLILCLKSCKIAIEPLGTLQLQGRTFCNLVFVGCQNSWVFSWVVWLKQFTFKTSSFIATTSLFLAVHLQETFIIWSVLVS